MATVLPYKALRYNEISSKASELCCPPYDIINEEQRLGYLAKNDKNIIRLELPKDGENPYSTAAKVLNEWLKKGILKKDEKPAFYIYEEEFDCLGQHYSFKGVIGRVELQEFSKGIVLPHEQTLSKAKNDRFELMKATNCNFSQIYSLYLDKENETPNLLNSVAVAPADVEFTDDDKVTHRLWVCDDQKVCDEITAQFEDRKLFIADGHHRYETGLNYRNYCKENNIANTDASDYIMMMLVDINNPGLVVLPTHRIVRDIDGFDMEALTIACEKYFTVSIEADIESVKNKMTNSYNNNKKAFGCYSGGKYYLFSLKDNAVLPKSLTDLCPALANLDVTVLHTLILEECLKIDKENMAKQINLSYTRDDIEGIEKVDAGANCCFFLNPTRISEIADVAEAGEKMPQKSTYFYPKLITGLVMNQLDK